MTERRTFRPGIDKVSTRDADFAEFLNTTVHIPGVGRRVLKSEASQYILIPTKKWQYGQLFSEETGVLRSEVTPKQLNAGIKYLETERLRVNAEIDARVAELERERDLLN